MILKELWEAGEELLLEQLEGPRGGGAWFAGTEEACQTNETIITPLVPYVNDYL
jgi:hypothetical protein